MSKHELSILKKYYEEGGLLETEQLLWRAFLALLKMAGPMLFLFLQVSSVRTAYEVRLAKSVGQLSTLPNITLCVNCVVWSLYGYLRADPTIFLPNVCGMLTSTFCMFEFHRYSSKKPYRSYVLGSIIGGICIYLATKGDDKTVGLLGCTLSVLFSASPLAVVRTVIKEQSTASLPFYTSLVIFSNNVSWLLYGLLVAKDVLIWGPNVLGLGLASLQMILFFVYGFGTPKSDLKIRKRPLDKVAAEHEV